MEAVARRQPALEHDPDDLDARPLDSSARRFHCDASKRGVTAIADVRRFPGSRRYPQYNQQALADSLAAAGAQYVWLPELGGRRRPQPDSPQTAWRNASFRAYADYMDTDEFEEGVARVIALTGTQRVARMCSEAVWWQCHRALTSDYLKIRGRAVIHLLSPRNHEEHPYTSAAQIVEGRLSYAA